MARWSGSTAPPARFASCTPGTDGTHPDSSAQGVALPGPSALAMLRSVSFEPESTPKRPRTPARAEVVGSLLRPPDLRAAIDAVYEPGHRAILPEERAKDQSELRAAQDAAIAEAVR